MSRSNLMLALRREPKPRKSVEKLGDSSILESIQQILRERATYGYRRVTTILKRMHQEKGLFVANHKRVYRIMRRSGLTLAAPPHRQKKAHDGKVQTLLSNTRWCSDGFSIQCWNGERVHVAFSLDTCDREVMRYIASTIGIDGQMIRDLMLETTEYRLGEPRAKSPIQWLSDNGPCYTARETVQFGRALGLDVRTTPTYSPESNGMAEAFVKTFKRDYAWFGDLKDPETVMKQLPIWIEDYNEKAPHKSLKMLSPREFLRNQKLAS